MPRQVAAADSASGWTSAAPLIEVLITAKFDMGGTVEDEQHLEALIDALRGPGDRLDPEDALDMVDARIYNISYLATHLPAKTIQSPVQEIELDSLKWEMSPSLVIYPWLGVLSVDLRFRPIGRKPSVSRLLAFYESFIAANNIDYLDYLHRRGKLARRLAPLRAQAAGPSLGVGERALAVQNACRGFVKARPLYPYQNVRVFYVLGTKAPSRRDDQLVRALVNLQASLAPASAPRAPVEALELDGLSLASTGWSTVASQQERGASRLGPDYHVAEEVYGLVHAQWFLCQRWCGVDSPTSPPSGTSALTDAADAQMRLENDLREVANLDVMFRDPARIAVARFFVDSLRVDRHRELARTNLNAIASRYRRLADDRAARFAGTLQVLFALAAAAGVAALLPSLTAATGTRLHLLAGTCAGGSTIGFLYVAHLYSGARPWRLWAVAITAAVVACMLAIGGTGRSTKPSRPTVTTSTSQPLVHP